MLIHYPAIVERKPDHSIPSYLYKEKPPQYDEEGHKEVQNKQKQQPQKPSTETPKQEPELKSTSEPALPTKEIQHQLKEIVERKQFNVMNIARDVQPVHLVGDKTVAKPLLILIGKALSAHLSYPKSAVDFGIRGIVLVGFMLSPDGEINYAQVVRTSGAGVLDDEALAAVKAMSPVKKVDTYLQESKFLVVGVIFG